MSDDYHGSGAQTAFALLCVFAASSSAAVVVDPVERSVIILVAGLLAVAILLWRPRSARVNRPESAPSALMSPPDMVELDAFPRLLETIADPVLILSGSLVRRANDAAMRLLGSHIIDADIRIVLKHPLASDIAQPAMAHLFDRPQELVGIGNRDQRWELRLTPLGSDWRMLLLIDRSGTHAIEKMRTDFVANASHELRTPLASIIGFAETLADDEAGGDPVTRKRFLRVMADEAQRMQKLVSDLISLSRIEAEKFKLPETTVDLVHLAEEVRGVFVDSHPARGRDIVVSHDADIPPVFGDRLQLSQLLHNLVSNSIKYGRAETPITIHVAPSRNGTSVRLSVSDEGDGISEEHLPRLTERFYRVDSGRSRSMGGTGLGLSIVKHIVERHQGRMDIRSEPQKGTTIGVTLPRADLPRAGA